MGQPSGLEALSQDALSNLHKTIDEWPSVVDRLRWRKYLVAKVYDVCSVVFAEMDDIKQDIKQKECDAN